MLPYEILIGLKGTMCICTRGLTKSRNLLQKVQIQNHNFSTVSLNNYLCLQAPYKDINTSKRRFYTQFMSSCQASPKDSKPIKNDTEQKLDDSLDNLIDNVGLEYKKDKNTKDTKFIPESVKNWLFTHSEKVPLREIEKKFPEPKLYLHNLYAVVINETKVRNCLQPSVSKVGMKNKSYWSFTYDVKWPENRSFTAVGHSKASASHSASLKVLYWLYINNRIKNRQPVIYDKSEILTIMNAPEELKIDTELLNSLDEFLDQYEPKIEEAINERKDSRPYEFQEVIEKLHPISNYRVHTYTRNETLKVRYENRINSAKPELPVFEYKDKIINELEDNQALVIKGDTGCGKTTQVPQFIIDHMSAQGVGADCSMIVTQPRRISAVSLAQRIASERGEKLGDVVGYQVRLNQVLPKQKGSILFCTTGMLLKKMQQNFNLGGCSHIIVDEAHERNVDTDMLLVLLKRAMKENPFLKLIVMSATINADLFQEYLNCNAVEIPGRCYPVQMNFLEDIEKLGFQAQYQDLSEKQKGEDAAETPIVDCDLISDLIRWITAKKPPGAILCFLPGWSQILKVEANLQQYSNAKQLVIPLHSKIPFLNQSKIFDPAPDGVRKVILATDIAETGITVPDVVYVVDSACRKEVRWHENKGVSSIDVHWVAKANINQRKGRAGRVQKGESFHFISKDLYNQLPAYPVPEVLRVSLEKVVLDSKTYSHEKAEQFLGSMPQPPRQSAVKKAVYDLQVLGALDQNENLTALGKRIALFSIHPTLSKAMVYSRIFQCVNPIASVSTALSMESEIFYGTLNDKSRIRQTKTHFHPSSDHLALAWIYAQWKSKIDKGTSDAYRFCKSYRISTDRMMILHKTRDINLDHLRESGLINNVEEASDLQNKENNYALLDELVRGVLLAGMDQILKRRDFEFKKGRFTTSDYSLVSEDNAKAQLSPECVNYKRKDWPSPYLIYYEKTHYQERRTTLIRESSIISPLTVLLFSQGRISGSLKQDEDSDVAKVLLHIEGKNNVNLCCDQHTAETILRFRDALWSMVHYYIENNVDERESISNDIQDVDRLAECQAEMLNWLAKLLSQVSEPIDAVKY